MTPTQAVPSRNVLAGALLAAVALVGSSPNLRSSPPPPPPPPAPVAVNVNLSEWKVELSERTVAAGAVTFTITNAGSIPHAFEVEGQGIEKETGTIQPGASDTLTLTLKPGTYEVYCPVGEDSHKKLGMKTDLKVVGATRSGASGYGDSEKSESPARGEKAQAIRV